MDRITKIALVSGIIILVAGVALAVLDMQIAPLMSGGFALLYYAFIRARLSRKGEVLGDERTRKVLYASMTFSWVITFAALVGTYTLIANDFFSPPPWALISAIMFVMALSFGAGMVYFSHRGL